MTLAARPGAMLGHLVKITFSTWQPLNKIINMSCPLANGDNVLYIEIIKNLVFRHGSHCFANGSIALTVAEI